MIRISEYLNCCDRELYYHPAQSSITKIFENFLKISSQIQFGIISITFYIDFLKDIASIFLEISGFMYNLYNYTLYIYILLIFLTLN